MSTVAVTGGNGHVGQGVLAHLADGDVRTVNVSRGSRSESLADGYCRTDLLDPGEVYGALARTDPHAVVHLGMIPNPEGTPGYRTFESNVMSTYYVLEAAAALGVETVVLASSMSAMGGGFETDPVGLSYLPVDEAHPLTPSNPYGLGKQVLEVVADGFARRGDGPATIASLRFPWVADDDQLREAFAETDRSLAGIRDQEILHLERNTLFTYVHLADAARATAAALDGDWTGHERFWITAADTDTTMPTADLVAAVYPDVECRTTFEGHESLVDTEKARARLGWTPERTWRDLE